VQQYLIVDTIRISNLEKIGNGQLNYMHKCFKLEKLSLQLALMLYKNGIKLSIKQTRK
jgi:hypothetical protein